MYSILCIVGMYNIRLRVQLKKSLYDMFASCTLFAVFQFGMYIVPHSKENKTNDENRETNYYYPNGKMLSTSDSNYYNHK